MPDLPRPLAGPPEHTPDELGAHVSTAGGCMHAPARAADIGSHVLQLFTKQPQRWAEPSVSDAGAAAFREARRAHGIRVAVAHASYLPNLASPDPALYARSLEAEVAELQRCAAYGIEYVVEHPGNATDGDHEAGLARNAEGIARALDAAPGDTLFLIETTAGAGHVLGATFEEIARMIEAIPAPLRARVGVCLDTCHVFAAGYDLVDDYHGVLARFDDTIGLERLRVMHLNDSLGTLGSRRDRHAAIGEGALGLAPFRCIMTDERLRYIPKLLETPKGDDPVASDRANLARLRRLRAES